MNAYLLWILLGTLQGILEWLPVSSEGQIVLFLLFIGVQNPQQAISSALWVNVGTFLAVVLYYRRYLLQLLTDPSSEASSIRKFLLFATIGTTVTGLPIRLVEDKIAAELGLLFMIVIALSLYMTGYLIQKWNTNTEFSESFRSLESVTSKESFFLGFIQGFAAIPGVSRSGVTVTYLLAKKFSIEDSFNGSFLVSIPASLGALVLEILFLIFRPESTAHLSFFPVVTGIFVAFVIGYLTLNLLITVAKKINFSIVCYAIATLILISILLSYIYLY